jgi:flavin-dependent dehydrogenase
LSTSDSIQDVVICGGGLAGLTLALQLKRRRPELNISVLEKRSGPAPESAFKVGESTVEIGAHYFSQVVGQFEHLKNQQLPKLGLRYFFSGDQHQDISQRMEYGGNDFLPTPSFQIDRGRFENHLWTECQKLDIEVLDDANITDLALPTPSDPGTVEAQCKGQRLSRRGHWVVDASGRRALIKRKLGLQEPVDHNVNSVWFRVAGRVDIEKWTDHSEWLKRMNQHPRWLSTNHLMGKGYWLWIIPLSSGHTSIGIVADEKLHPYASMSQLGKAMDWILQHEPQCHQHLQDLEVLDFLGYKNFSYSCTQAFSSDRWTLVGEAGRFLDPFYSPGSDYIGISNTLTTELILSERSGGRINAQSQIYDTVFRQFFDIHLELYHNQYEMFGSGVTMTAKIVWDFSYYWCIPAFLFFNDLLGDLHLFAKYQGELEAISRENARVQKILRQTTADQFAPARFIDLQKIPCMPRLNTSLSQKLEASEKTRVLESNFEFLRELAQDVLKFCESLEKRTTSPVDPKALRHLEELWKMIFPID